MFYLFLLYINNINTSYLLHFIFVHLCCLLWKLSIYQSKNTPVCALHNCNQYAVNCFGWLNRGNIPFLIFSHHKKYIFFVIILTSLHQTSYLTSWREYNKKSKNVMAKFELGAISTQDKYIACTVIDRCQNSWGTSSL